jgi:tripartite-type tricarboxylate transporter receptor subunit TctC
MRLRAFLATAAALATLAPGATHAADPPYPSRPVKMIVPFAPAGASDFVARIVSPKLSELLGQQVIIENRVGASGNIGLEAAGHAAPDGYTIFLGNIGTIAINPGVFKTMPVDTRKDLVAVTLVAEVPSILVANPKLAANDVAGLVALAKSKPGALNFGSPGPSTLNRLEMESFMRMARINMMHIPYKGGAGPAVTGLVAGETQLMFVTLSSAMAFVQSGHLKPLAVTTKQRLEALPQVPTMIEAGYPEMVSSSWQGVFVPAGTPKAVVAKLHAALVAAFDSAEVRKKLAVGGATVVTSRTPEEFAAFVNTEVSKWGQVARDAGVTAE